MTAILSGIIVILLIYIILQQKRTHPDGPAGSQPSAKPALEEPPLHPPTENKTSKEENKEEPPTPAEPTEQPSEIEITPEFNRIRQFLFDDKEPLLLVTGGAGTGKTTLIQRLHENIPNSAICAFTGMAALNSRGSTIHSLFQLPPLTFLPEALPQTVKQLNFSKRNILDHLTLLIIDEISMVRADLLDAIDYSLRLNRETDLPFGGVQLLMVGDPYQLPPIVGKKNSSNGTPPSSKACSASSSSPWPC